MNSNSKRSTLGFKIKHHRNAAIELENYSNCQSISSNNPYYPNVKDFSLDKKDHKIDKIKRKLCINTFSSKFDPIKNLITLKNILPISNHNNQTKSLITNSFDIKESSLIMITNNSITNQTMNQGTLNSLSKENCKEKTSSYKQKKTKSMSLEAKKYLKNILNSCKKEEPSHLNAYHHINRVLNKSITYFDVYNPLSIQRNKTNKNFSKLINDNEKLSLSFLSKDKNKMMTVGQDKVDSNYFANFKPETIYKFKNIFKERYGVNISNESKKVVNGVSTYLQNGTFKSNSIINMKLLSLPKHNLTKSNK